MNATSPKSDPAKLAQHTHLHTWHSFDTIFSKISMKTRLISLFTLVAICLLISFLIWRHNNAVSRGANVQSNSAINAGAGLAVTKHMTHGDRINELEKAGEMPDDDQNLSDWQLAQKTSWWGKPLDPNEFWRGRVIWNDKKAASDAHRHGRAYPPMPYADTNLSSYPNDDGIHGSYLPDSPNILYASSSKERAFWDRFGKTNPRPPDQIDQAQFSAAVRLLRYGDNEVIGKVPATLNFPPDAFAKDALFWAYVQAERAESRALLDSGVTTNQPGFQNFIGNLLVDSKYVLQPLTPDQIEAANLWKIAYLKRLQSQNANQSYINAYLQAWNLSSNEVFKQGN
jgi:hypothetical protein